MRASTATVPILVGVVGAPHGIKGEVRLKSFTGRPASMAGYGPLRTEGGDRLVIQTARPLKGDMLVVRFEGVSTREAAAALTGTRLHVDRSALPPPDEEEFYDADLIGLAATTDDGADVGRVRAVLNYGAGDILDIESSGGESLLVAFTKAFVPVVDIDARRIVIAAAALLPDDAGEGSADEPEGG